MKELELALKKIQNESIEELFNIFFEVIQYSLEIKDKDRNLPFYKRKPDKELRSLIENKEVLQFKHFDSFIKNLQALEKNAAYLETTEWKILTTYSIGLISSQNPSAVYEALDYLKQFEFFGENNFSVIKVASIIYSLSQSEPFETAKMLVRLSCFKLLTEQNLGKISAYPKLNVTLFSSVLNKLRLIEEGKTSHLLTQANLDKLLDNPDLNLNVLAKLIEVEDKSKILTQEKFDLAISLKDPLIQENIEKIEKSVFDSKKLTDVISLLGQAGILTQDNFDSLITFSETALKKIVPALAGMHKAQILDQGNFDNFLNTFLNVSKDAEHDQADSSSFERSSSSLADGLCETLVSLLSRVRKYFQEFFDKILEFFNEKAAQTNEANLVDQETITNNLGSNSGAFFKPSVSEPKNTMEITGLTASTSNIVKCN